MSLELGANSANFGYSSGVKVAPRTRRVDIPREGKIQKLVSEYEPQINNDLKFDLAHFIPSLQKEAQYIKDQWINDNEVVGHKRKLSDSKLSVKKLPKTPVSNQDEYKALFFKPLQEGQYLPRSHYKTVTYKEPFNKNEGNIEISVESADDSYQFAHSKKDSSVSFHINSNWVFGRFLKQFDNVNEKDKPEQIASLLSDLIAKIKLSPAQLKPLVGHEINTIRFCLSPSEDYTRKDDPTMEIFLSRSTKDRNTIELALFLPNKEPLNFVFQENSV